MYFAPREDDSTRAIVVFIELSKNLCGRYEQSACIQYTLDGGLLSQGNSIEFEWLSSVCSCSTRYKTSCPHRTYVAGDRLVCSEIAYILSLPVVAPPRAGPTSKWEAVLLGARSKATNASWIAIRISGNSLRGCDFVGVNEARGSRKAAKPLSRRLRCTKCRLSSANRGICVHESTILEAAKALDEEEAVEATEAVSNRSAKMS